MLKYLNKLIFLGPVKKSISQGSRCLKLLPKGLVRRVRISPSVLASHPLALTALSSLSSEFLSEAGVNVTSPLDASVQLPLIQVIVPQVMNLRPMINDRSKVLMKR